MRIHFQHLGHAECYLKTCKRKLVDHLNHTSDAKMPSQRVRNAFCRGFGYSSYDELKRVLAVPARELKPLPSEEELLGAFTKSFFLAFEVLSEYGHARATLDQSMLSTLARGAFDEIERKRSSR